MRLIDADAILNKFEWKEDSPLYIRAIRAAIEAEPTIDAVQVARCKDCIYNPKKDEHTTQCPCSTTGDPFLDWIPDDNWFCAEGERGEE